ncbi:MAG: hypothetical protein PF513_00465 [Tenericutes bacterium]|jgi:hypothetical protein|nr:hypothetical protein [Mycoplasmatota bacterium]
MKKVLSQSFKNFKSPYVLSWFILSFTILYVYITVLFEFSDWMILIYAILVIPLMFGLSNLYREERKRKTLFKIDYYDGILAGIGVILTYLIAHQLDLSAVIASSFIGLLGFLLLKKYSVAIYCGSFAGMVSSFMFDYLEVASIAIFCGLLFALLKPAFKGMGGKLGTTAFLSTILIATFFEKDFMIVINDLNIFRLIIISLLGAIIPFYIQHYFKQSAVLASALPSLIFALIMIYIVQDYLTCTVVFFSASFIAMSSKRRIPNILYLFIAAFIHAFLFLVYFEHYNGLGGKLGLMALTSVVITIGLKYLFELIVTKYKTKGIE